MHWLPTREASTRTRVCCSLAIKSGQNIIFTAVRSSPERQAGQLPDRLLWTFVIVELSKMIIIEFMSFNHHYPCSEVWAQGDLRRASCEAERAACASEVFRLLELLPESLEWWKEGKVELC